MVFQTLIFCTFIQKTTKPFYIFHLHYRHMRCRNTLCHRNITEDSIHSLYAHYCDMYYRTLKGKKTETMIKEHAFPHIIIKKHIACTDFHIYTKHTTRQVNVMVFILLYSIEQAVHRRCCLVKIVE